MGGHPGNVGVFALGKQSVEVEVCPVDRGVKPVERDFTVARKRIQEGPD